MNRKYHLPAPFFSMNYLLAAFLISMTMFGPLMVRGQTAKSALDRYIDSAQTILVVKCLAVGPVNILLRANVQVRILQVVKGKETLREISVDSQYGMTPGKMYLIRTESEAMANGDYFRVDTIDSAIPIWDGEDLNILKTLSPRIVVLRTMNLRVDTLEVEIRRRTYELEALKKARSGN